MNWVNLYDVLSWLLTVGAGVCSWGLLDILERREWRVRWIKRLSVWVGGLDFQAKRFTALIVAAVFTLAAWGVEMLFFYVAPPSSWRAGVEQAISYLLVSLPLAFTASQIAHARAHTARAQMLEEPMEPRG